MRRLRRYWDESRGLVLINYFPGFAYLWLISWFFGFLVLAILASTNNPCTASRFKIVIRVAAARRLASQPSPVVSAGDRRRKPRLRQLANGRACGERAPKQLAQATVVRAGPLSRLRPPLAKAPTCRTRPDAVVAPVFSQVAAFVYWLFWLVIPLLGFSWFFAWRSWLKHGPQSCVHSGLWARGRFEADFRIRWGFVDAVVSQHSSPAIAAARPFSDAAAQALGQPFAAGIWLGFSCWLLGSVAATNQNLRHYYRLRTDPEYRQARFLAANIQDAARDGPGATQVRNGVVRVHRGTPIRGSQATDSGAVEMV